MEAILKIRGDFTRFVRSDSVAVLKKKFTVAGDAYVEIRKGEGEPLPKDGGYITCVTDEDLIEQFRGTVEDVRTGAVEAIDKLKSVLDEHAALAAQLRDPEGSLQQLIGHMNTISAGLAEGEGTAGKLLRDPALADELEKLLASLNQSVTQVSDVLSKLQTTADKLCATSRWTRLSRCNPLWLTGRNFGAAVVPLVRAYMTGGSRVRQGSPVRRCLSI